MRLLNRFVVINKVADLNEGDIFEEAPWNSRVWIWDKSPAFDKNSDDSRLRGIYLENWTCLEGNIEYIDPVPYQETNFFKFRSLVKEKHSAWRKKRGEAKHAAHEEMQKGKSKKKNEVQVKRTRTRNPTASIKIFSSSL